MPNLIEFTDFQGTSRLQKDNNTVVKFDAIRDEKESEFMANVLGAELSTLMYADLDVNGVPQTARFTALYDKFQIDLNECVIQSLGIKRMCVYIIWFFYARDNNIYISVGGNFASKSQNSDQASDPVNLAKNYNKGITTGKAIQVFIEENEADYPEYNGQVLNLMSMF